jgi:hypothetical protein
MVDSFSIKGRRFRNAEPRHHKGINGCGAVQRSEVGAHPD